MLKFEMNGNSLMIESNGSLRNTIYGCCAMIRELYFSMMRNHPDMASAFRKAMERLMTDGDSHMWDESKKSDPQVEIFIPYHRNKE